MTQQGEHATTSQVQPHIDDQTSRLIGEMVDARLNWSSLEWQLYFETTVRHFPGIAPALRTDWEHAFEECLCGGDSCCVTGVEPW